MAAILEIPQYVAYQENVAYALLTLFTKAQTFNNTAQYHFLVLIRPSILNQALTLTLFDTCPGRGALKNIRLHLWLHNLQPATA